MKRNLQRVDPANAAAKAVVYEGGLPLQGMKRLAANLVNAQGEAHYKVEFYYDEEDILVCELHIRAALPVVGQTDDEVETIDVNLEEYLQPMSQESIDAGIETKYETCVMQNNCLNLLKIIEDSLLLALPMSFMR